MTIPRESLRPWHRFSVRVALLFMIITLLGIGLVGLLVYDRQRQELETTLGGLLLNVARTGALIIDPDLHAEVEATLTQDVEAYRRLRTALAGIQDANQIETPIYTLTHFEPVKHQARFMVTSRGPGLPGEAYILSPALLDPLGRAFREGVATRTAIYHNEHGTWITAFAPIRDALGRIFAVLDVDYRVDVYTARLAKIRYTVLQASLLGGVLALVAGIFLARQVTGPIRALTRGVARVADGDLSQTLPVTSNDEVGLLTRTFNGMLEGLRQRDFIRDTFGRYVSPEVVQTLIESPEALRLGGEKREVTVLMSDLRGYTHLAEKSDPAVVVQILNDYLGQMTDIIVEHGGTINDFMGDGIFAIFGAPMRYPDHAERAAACALAMQLAMTEVNQRNIARDLPQLEMGIGLNTGDVIVGNIGSEKRAKYSVVGNTVNLAARVEAATVGGQILLSPFIYEHLRDLAEVKAPVSFEVKGISEPLLLYEIRGLRGRYARHLPDSVADDGRRVPVTLPLRCWVIEDKVVRGDCISGEVRRLGPRYLEARLEAAVPRTAQVRLRLHYPERSQDSGDLYGNVLAIDEDADTGMVRIVLTSIGETDRQILHAYLETSESSQT